MCGGYICLYCVSGPCAATVTATVTAWLQSQVHCTWLRAGQPAPDSPCRTRTSSQHNINKLNNSDPIIINLDTRNMFYSDRQMHLSVVMIQHMKTALYRQSMSILSWTMAMSPHQAVMSHVSCLTMPHLLAGKYWLLGGRAVGHWGAPCCREPSTAMSDVTLLCY